MDEIYVDQVDAIRFVRAALRTSLFDWCALCCCVKIRSFCCARGDLTGVMSHICGTLNKQGRYVMIETLVVRGKKNVMGKRHFL